MMYLANPYPAAGKVSVLSLTAELVDGSRRPVPLSDVRHTTPHICCNCLASHISVMSRGPFQGHWSAILPEVFALLSAHRSCCVL